MNGQRAGKDNIMTNTTSSSTTFTTIKTASTSKKFAFTYDHVNQKIVGTDINFQKAGIPGSALEKELLARMEARPAYGFTIIPTEKKPAKQSYKGLNFELMMDYVEIKGTEFQKAEFEEIVNRDSSFPVIKSWFVENFKVGFTVEKAKHEIAVAKNNAKKMAARDALKAQKAAVRKVVKANMAKATEVKAPPAVINF